MFFPVKLKPYNIPKDIRCCVIDRRDLVCVVPAVGEVMNTYYVVSHQSAVSIGVVR